MVLCLPPEHIGFGLQLARFGQAQPGTRPVIVGFSGPKHLLGLDNQRLVLDDRRLLLVNVFDQLRHPQLRQELALAHAVADIQW